MLPEKIQLFASGELEHFHIEIVYSDKMFWPCEMQCSKAREIGVGELCSPLSDKLKAKLL